MNLKALSWKDSEEIPKLMCSVECPSGHIRNFQVSAHSFNYSPFIKKKLNDLSENRLIKQAFPLIEACSCYINSQDKGIRLIF